MDLALYLRVVWRFRALVAAGLGLGFLAAVLSVATPVADGFRPSLAYRAPKVWASEATLLVTQRGFPWGRSTFSGEDQFRFADTTRFTSLAMLYSELAEGDAVRGLLAKSRDHAGQIDVRPRVAADNVTVLPILGVTGTSTSPAAAQRLALDGSRALQAYLVREQEAAGIPSAERVEIVLVRRPLGATVVAEPSLVRPVFVFMLIALATVALAFVLENLRPRAGLTVAAPAQPEQLRRRRSRRARAR